MEINKVGVKTIITKSNLPDADFVINPYIGCAHACIYCYADFMRRFTGHVNDKWGGFVDVKINASEKIPQKNFGNSVILIGSVTDPYQLCEAKYKITRSCLEKLLLLQPKIEILTKSHLVLRDIDLLKKFRNINVGISIGILDGDDARGLEPRASSPKLRIQAIRKLSEAGVNVYLFISPIFPEISDYKKTIELSREYIDEVLFENLNIRANNRKKIFSFISAKHPELLGVYQNISDQYWDGLEKEIIEYCKSRGIKCKTYFHHGKKEAANPSVPSKSGSN